MAKIILYGIYYAFITLTLIGFGNFIFRKVRNLLTPPFNCVSEVISKKPTYRMVPSRGAGTFFTVYTITIRLPEGQIRQYNVSIDLYLSVEEGETYDFYVVGERITEVTVLESII